MKKVWPGFFQVKYFAYYYRVIINQSNKVQQKLATNKMTNLQQSELKQQVWAIYDSSILSPIDNVRLLQYFENSIEDPNNEYTQKYLKEMMDYATEEINMREQRRAIRKAQRLANLK